MSSTTSKPKTIRDAFNLNAQMHNRVLKQNVLDQLDRADVRRWQRIDKLLARDDMPDLDGVGNTVLNFGGGEDESAVVGEEQKEGDLKNRVQALQQAVEKLTNLVGPRDGVSERVNMVDKLMRQNSLSEHIVDEAVVFVRKQYKEVHEVPEAITYAPSVCRLKLGRLQDGERVEYTGTAFVVRAGGEDEDDDNVGYWLLTNYHNLRTDEEVTNCKALFFHEENSVGAQQLEVDLDYSTLVNAPPPLDFAFVQVARRHWPVLRQSWVSALDIELDLPVKNEKVHVIQHPFLPDRSTAFKKVLDGKVLSVRGNQTLRHDVNTVGGSSGSPVFVRRPAAVDEGTRSNSSSSSSSNNNSSSTDNTVWRVVALHRAGVYWRRNEDGTPMMIAHKNNQNIGVLLSAIRQAAIKRARDDTTYNSARFKRVCAVMRWQW